MLLHRPTRNECCVHPCRWVFVGKGQHGGRPYETHHEARGIHDCCLGSSDRLGACARQGIPVRHGVAHRVERSEHELADDLARRVRDRVSERHHRVYLDQQLFGSGARPSARAGDLDRSPTASPCRSSARTPSKARSARRSRRAFRSWPSTSPTASGRRAHPLPDVRRRRRVSDRQEARRVCSGAGRGRRDPEADARRVRKPRLGPPGPEGALRRA